MQAFTLSMQETGHFFDKYMMIYSHAYTWDEGSVGPAADIQAIYRQGRNTLDITVKSGATP